MISYTKIQRTKLERLRTTVDELKGHLDMMQAVLTLSNQSGWLKYKEGMENLMRLKVDALLVMEIDEHGIEYLDRKKAELGAEIKLLKQILVAPDRYADQAPQLRAQIEAFENEIRSLERQVGSRKEN